MDAMLDSALDRDAITDLTVSTHLWVLERILRADPAKAQCCQTQQIDGSRTGYIAGS